MSDAIELAACVIARDGLASTGATIAIWLIAALAAGLIATGLVLARKRHLFAAAVRTDAVV
ncbi:LPXTG cell wall anchor domain-containing protein [Cryocola sp. 340MFSha3.1]|uniref:LPXTG cell wall anchor domain-containing protein n=1 Tax=Cryocola sp. 340MFSha3.1 TaxID=1169145 RepID=UPI00036A59B1|nr:LPXTG cell wall anchor domain-containing protein [Cryocola sp. 340MFSha3.1]